MCVFLVCQSLAYAAPMDCAEPVEEPPCHEIEGDSMAGGTDCDHCQDCLLPQSSPALDTDLRVAGDRAALVPSPSQLSYLSPGYEIYHPPNSLNA